MDELRVREELGEIRGQLAALPAIVAQAMEPKLEKLKREVTDEVRSSIAHCREVQQPKFDNLEQSSCGVKSDVEHMRSKQAKSGIAIVVLALAFVGSLGGSTIADALTPIIKGLIH